MQRRLPGLVVIAACLLPFLRLGMGEIQPWDESLYAIRAEACLKFGAWLDQTQYAVGHLYSATHPPLGVWLIAISKYLFGDSTFAVRLPIALAASGSLLLVYLMLRKLVSREAAFVGAVSLATADLFLILSHRAQMESVVLFFSVASIYALLEAIEKERWTWSVLSGLLLGLGLLTKFAVAFFVIPFILLMPWAFGKPRAIRYSMLSIVVSVAFAAPWFLMMAMHHPDYWTHVTGSLATLSEGSYAPSSLAWWYYVNRLIVGLPLIVIALLVRRPSRLFLASLAWLVTLLIVLQLVGTRMPHFAFLLLAPGAMLIASGWNNLTALNSKWRALLFITVLLLIGWSASEQVRLFLTHRIAWNDIIIRPAGMVAMLIALALAGIAWRYVRDEMRYACAFSIILFGIALVHLFSEEESVFEKGARNVAAIVSMLPSKNNLVIIHSNFPNEQYAPQLAYYTGGWTLGWIPKKESEAIAWDSATTNKYLPDSSRDIAVVMRFEDRFYHPPARERALLDTLDRKLRGSFPNQRMFRSYIIYY